MSSSAGKFLHTPIAFDIETYASDQALEPPSDSLPCAWCQLPFSRHQPPVLLKSGHRLHLDCYYELQRPPSGPPN